MGSKAIKGILSADRISFSFGVNNALDEVSLDVQAGEVYCLLGANGAGKTTLVNMFLGFLNPDQGTATVADHQVSVFPEQTKRDLANIAEQVSLYGVLTGIENLCYFAELGTGNQLSLEKARELIVHCGLDASAGDRRVSTYSKGMRQKIGISIAMAKQAKALLLDEPTSGLDPKAAYEFSMLMLKEKERGVAVLMTTHDLFHAKQIGNRIGIMKQGRIVQELDASDVSHTDLEAIYLRQMSAS